MWSEHKHGAETIMMRHDRWLMLTPTPDVVKTFAEWSHEYDVDTGFVENIQMVVSPNRDNYFFVWRDGGGWWRSTKRRNRRVATSHAAADDGIDVMTGTSATRDLDVSEPLHSMSLN